MHIFRAESLYTVPQGVKALTQGNLEVLTSQLGKTSRIELLANVVLGVGKLRTGGVIDGIDKTQTFKDLAAYFNQSQNITMLSAGHMSMYLDAGAVKSQLIGLAPGEFTYATLIAAMLFGAIPGSSTTVAVATSGIAYPVMIKRGYPKWKAASGVAFLIPPSITLALFSVIT